LVFNNPDLEKGLSNGTDAAGVCKQDVSNTMYYYDHILIMNYSQEDFMPSEL
jgi:hypothetical protein